MGEISRTLVNTKGPAQKKIKLKDFSISSNVSKIAKQVMNSTKKYCKPNNLNQIENLLRKLKRRLQNVEDNNPSTAAFNNSNQQRGHLNSAPSSSNNSQDLNSTSSPPKPPPTISNVKITTKPTSKNSHYNKISISSTNTGQNDEVSKLREQIRREELAKIKAD